MIFLFCLVVPSILFATTYEGKVVNVISGDTLIVNIGGKEYEITLDYIEAPEQGQNFYDEAKQFAKKLALDQNVSVSTKENFAFRPQTITAEVYVSKKTESLNRELVRAGLAWCKIENGNPYDITLNFAKKRHLGIWSETNPQPPWEYKKISAAERAAELLKSQEANRKAVKVMLAEKENEKKRLQEEKETKASIERLNYWQARAKADQESIRNYSDDKVAAARTIMNLARQDCNIHEEGSHLVVEMKMYIADPNKLLGYVRSIADADAVLNGTSRNIYYYDPSSNKIAQADTLNGIRLTK